MGQSEYFLGGGARTSLRKTPVNYNDAKGKN